MVGLTLKLCWSHSGLEISIRRHFRWQRKTYFQCGNAKFDDGYAHIFAIAILYSVWNICFPFGMSEFLYVSNKQLVISPDLLFFALQLWYLSFFQKRSCDDNNYECMLLAYMKRSHPHITLYQEVIFFSWVGIILRNFASLVIILFSLYLASFGPPSPGGLTMILCH